MTHLLDTATFLWAVQAPEKLSRKAKAVCTGEGYEPGVSVVSLLELIIKVQKGKLALTPDPVTWWNTHTRYLTFPVLPVRQKHIERLWSLPPIHKDPSDRILIAQATCENIPVVTADKIMGSYPVEVVW